MKSVLITSQKSAFNKYLIKVFERSGYDVYIPGINEPKKRLDIYIDVSNKRDVNDNFSIRDGLSEKIIQKVYNANVTVPMKLLEKYLPFLDRGTDKRLCFLSGIDASINETRDTTGYAYKLSKAAMHNLFMIAWNTLEKDGYTFRVYDPLLNEVSIAASANAAFTYFTLRRGTENDDPLRDDENRLVMRDALGREHAW